MEIISICINVAEVEHGSTHLRYLWNNCVRRLYQMVVKNPQKRISAARGKIIDICSSKKKSPSKSGGRQIKKFRINDRRKDNVFIT